MPKLCRSQSLSSKRLSCQNIGVTIVLCQNIGRCYIGASIGHLISWPEVDRGSKFLLIAYQSTCTSCASVGDIIMVNIGLQLCFYSYFILKSITISEENSLSGGWSSAGWAFLKNLVATQATQHGFPNPWHHSDDMQKVTLCFLAFCAACFLQCQSLLNRIGLSQSNLQGHPEKMNETASPRGGLHAPVLALISYYYFYYDMFSRWVHDI